MTTVTLQDVIREELRWINKLNDKQNRLDELMSLAEQVSSQLKNISEEVFPLTEELGIPETGGRFWNGAINAYNESLRYLVDRGLIVR